MTSNIKTLFNKGKDRAEAGRAVILFTRAPEPGRTKTRMKPYLDDDQCAELHTCFLKDIISELKATGADVILCYDSSNGAGRLKDICGRDCVYYPQIGDDLGVRMNRALEKAFDMGYRKCVLIGSDIPEMRASDINEAFRILDHRDVVIGPSEDGGYWLIGMNRLHQCLFKEREYSHGSVLDELIASASADGLKYGLVVGRRDMDTPGDLADYRSRMRKDRHLRKSNTGKYIRDLMSIALIVPVYNEVTTIDKMVAQLEELKDQFEIIIVDGGSTDGTCDHIPKEFCLIHSAKGRALQMNAGAEASHGESLFFLHCDSELPVDPAAEIRRVLAGYETGCFGIAFHSRQFFMWTNRVISNCRAKWHGVMFGDQGIFMTRELFDRIGGYPEIPIMEDYQVSLNLRKAGIRPGMCRHRIYTSDRRYPKSSIPKLQLMHKMYRLRRDYKAGVPADVIAAEYEDVR